ncbi:MAG: TIGR02679 family protein [Pseudonocardiaceae bacterium]
MTVELRSKLSPALAPVWRAVHERLSSGRPVSRVRVGPLTDEQRSALADLLGMPRLPSEYATVELSRLDQVLRDAVGTGIREVVVELIGPVGDRAGDRLRVAAERAELWTWLEQHPVVTSQPVLAGWVAGVRQAGLIGGSVPRTRDELHQALQVLAALPASGVPLPVLADQVLHDSHGLDEGTRCAGLVTRALASIYEVAMPADAQQRRALWERAGVADDELSSVVLAAGLRPPGDDPASQILRVCADAGQAAALTLGQIRVTAWAHGLPAIAWVFENPSVLALALARFGTRCPPLVCTSGWPSSAGILLLRKLAAVGCRLRYHGDFDGEGIRIAANVLAGTGATPWRMSTEDYRSALRELPSGPPVGRVTEAPWDEHLATALRETGVTVSEERVARRLLDEWEQRPAT